MPGVLFLNTDFYSRRGSNSLELDSVEGRVHGPVRIILRLELYIDDEFWEVYNNENVISGVRNCTRGSGTGRDGWDGRVGLDHNESGRIRCPRCEIYRWGSRKVKELEGSRNGL